MRAGPFLKLIVFLPILLVFTLLHAQVKKAAFWLSDPDSGILFRQQPSISPEGGKLFARPTQDLPQPGQFIVVNPAQEYQSVDGFGWA